MLSSLPPYLLYLSALILSCVISLYAVKKTIFIARRMKIYDVPDKIRKIHSAGISNLGGIGVFTGFILVAVFFWQRDSFFMPAILSSCALLFFTGIYDDLVNMKPSKKLIAQLTASFITVYFANMRMEAFFDAFGLPEVPYLASVIFTILCCTFFINVFNFIDGIDALAGSLAILYLSILGGLFALSGQEMTAGMIFALLGATAGLLWYNAAPAKIYMGDTGSMFLGFIIFNFTLLYISQPDYSAAVYIHGTHQAVLLSIAMLFMPVYDGIRVFVLRAMKGISPLKADRRHLHYYLLDAGCSHTQAVGIIVGMNVLVIVLACLMQDMNIYVALGSCVMLVSAIVMMIYKWRERKMR